MRLMFPLLLFVLLSSAVMAQPPQPALPPGNEASAEKSRLWQEAHKQAGEKNWAAAVRNAEAALVLARKQSIESSLELCLILEGLSHWQCRLRNSPAALACAQEAADMRTRLLGKDHWLSVDARENVMLTERLAKLTDDGWQAFLRADALHAEAADLQRQGKHTEALAKAGEALPIYTEILGRERTVTLTCLSNMTVCELELARYFQAQPHVAELIDAQPRLKGMLHPDTILALRLLGRFNEAIGDLANAEDAFQKVVEIRRAMAGPDHPETIAASVEAAKVCADRRKFAIAEPMLVSALKRQRDLLGEDRPETLQTMKILGAMYCEQEKFKEAEPLLVKCAEQLRKLAGEKHLATAGALNALGKLYLHTRRYRQANDCFMDSAAICLATVGDKHPIAAKVYDNTAELYELGANPGMARQLRLQILRIAEASYGETNLLTAKAQADVARTYIVMNDGGMAETYLLRARETRRKLQGEGHPDTARVMGQLAYVYLIVGDAQRAEPLFQQALRILDQGDEKDILEGARLRKSLALLDQSLGKFTEAEANYRQALAAVDKIAGPNTLAAAEIKTGLAQTILSRGDCQQACRLMDDALAAYERELDPNHPHWLNALGVAGMARLAADDTATAERLLTRSLQISQRAIERSGAYQSERQRLVQMMAMRNTFDLYLSLPITLRTQGSGLYPFVLTWKGATATRQWRDRQLATDDTAPLDAELQQICRRLSLLTLHPPDASQHRVWMGEIFRLNMRKENLEQQRAVSSARLHNQAHEVAVADIHKVLAPGTALADFYQYTHTSFKRAGGAVEMKKEQRYLAFVVRRDRPVTRIDLGGAAPIWEAAAKWRNTRGFRPDKGKTEWGKVVGELIWPKLKPFVDGCDTLLVSPDGILSHIPWNALPGKARGTYLIEDYAIAMVPVPQLLPAMMAAKPATAGARPRENSLLLVGDIDFNAAASHPHEAPARVSPASLPRAAGAMSFAALTGTAAEVQALRSQFAEQFPGSGAVLLDKAQATEEALWSEAPRHRWLHIATHGFFAPPSIKAAIAVQSQLDPNAQQRDEVSVFHVGYLNGLALAGANVGPHERECKPTEVAADGSVTDKSNFSADGILTAAELATMDLRNVDVVVLSGCETGLGEIQGGEGALGMQRALQIAGVGTTVGSLWTVPDGKTNLLMQRFYANLWERKLPRLAALREAQLWMLRGGKDADASPVDKPAPRVSPHYWAAFTLSGDWR